MTLHTYTLRVTPLLLPLFAVAATVAGLASRLGTFPNIENIIFVSYATVLSGIVPMCFVLGVALLIVDLRWPTIRTILLGLAAMVACAVLVAGYFYGRGLDF